MLFSKGPSETEQKLMNRIAELAKANSDLKNQVAHLVNNSRRWATKFKSPLYAVPEKYIARMEAETEAYKEQTRAEINTLQARISLLNERILDFTEKEYTDQFGSATGTDQITFELATDHINGVPTKNDRKVVDLQLSEGWLKRFDKRSSNKGT